MLRLLSIPLRAGALALAGILALPAGSGPAAAVDGSAYVSPDADAQRPQATAATYSNEELIEAGHTFFGEAASGLASVFESLLSRFGEPNGYILGEEGSGAVLGGLRYGEGALYTRTMGDRRVYWQGPSFGWDFGGAGSRVMMLVYDLPSPQTLMQRFTGIDGSAYFVGGLSVTVMAADTTYLVPVRTGVGLRLGMNIGYLKFTEQPTWNPF